MKVDTSKFVAAHGKNPRGKGTWMFEIVEGPAKTFEFWARANASWGEAKKEAIQAAQDEGYARVILLP